MSRIEYLSPEGLRIDGRKATELRNITCRLGLFPHCDGSSYVEMGATKVIATVYGPHEPKMKSKTLHDRALINCEFNMATFSTGSRRKRPKGDRRTTEMAMMIRQIFQSAIVTTNYPRSQIDIYVQVIQADGGQLSACVNAATLAVIDAGIPLSDYVCSCTASQIDNTPILDMNHTEKSAGGPELVLAVLPKSKKILMCQMDQRLHIDRLDDVMNLAVDGCDQIMQKFDQTVCHRTSQLLASYGK
eukprot:CFRG5698T1